jgi:hypothetical protein
MHIDSEVYLNSYFWRPIMDISPRKKDRSSSHLCLTEHLFFKLKNIYVSMISTNQLQCTCILSKSQACVYKLPVVIQCTICYRAVSQLLETTGTSNRHGTQYRCVSRTKCTDRMKRALPNISHKCSSFRYQGKSRATADLNKNVCFYHGLRII